MGEITDGWFEGRARKREGKNLDLQGKNVDHQQRIEGQKRDFAKRLSDTDAAGVLDAADPEELDMRIQSHLDRLSVGDTAAGEDAASLEDSFLSQLDAEEGLYRREWSSLRNQAVSAQARLTGYFPRAAGYDSPASSGKAASVGPILLTVAVGIVEWLQTANWFSNNLSLTQSSIGGTWRSALTLLISGLLTAIVMAVTFLAGRKLKEGVIARRARIAEGLPTGGGAELGQGIGIAIAAVVFQTVTLGLRFSSESSDESAQAGAIVIGIVSFCGALVVLLWEYSSFNPAPSVARAVYTRQADAAKIDEFRQKEYRLQMGIPIAKRNLEIAGLRREERALQKLQPSAMERGTAQMAKLNSRLDDIRQDIKALREKTFEYEQVDLEQAAFELKQRIDAGGR